MTDDASSTRELWSRDKRIWVRLDTVCNNRCMFCLDSDCLDGRMESREEVLRQMEAGRGEGGERLILSGGEATLHPGFVDFVREGRRLGYQWIQTISNGRMFAYRKFCDSALAAGLNEVTVSMHGHTPELHDRLVGVQGAFAQSLTGLKNLRGRAVVSVDIVLNRLNIRHLPAMIEFFNAVGVSEFDLLHLVPFGRAWKEHRDVLFFDPAMAVPYLKKVFDFAGKRNLVVWTNRLPPALLEGHETHIQDPYKLHDEVRGRRSMFEKWRDQGVAPSCAGERCRHCPVAGFCSELSMVLQSLGQGPVDTGTEAVEAVPGPRKVAERVAHADQRPLVVRFGQGQESVALQQVAAAVESGAVVCRLVADGSGWPSHQLLQRIHRLLDPLELPARHQGCRIEVEIPEGLLGVASHYASCAELGLLILSGGPYDPTLLASATGAGVRLSLVLPKADAGASAVNWGPRLSEFDWRIEPKTSAAEVERLDPGPDCLRRLTAKTEIDVGRGLIDGVPICLGGRPAVSASPVAGACPDFLLLDQSGRLDLVAFTDWFIKYRYTVKSLRCNACHAFNVCPGMHINYARVYGLTCLQPITKD